MSNIDEIAQSVAEYKSITVSTVPPPEKDKFLEWSRTEMLTLTNKEKEIRDHIAHVRTHLKAELLRLNAIEHDLLYTASEHPVYVAIAAMKKEKLH